MGHRTNMRGKHHQSSNIKGLVIGASAAVIAVIVIFLVFSHLSDQKRQTASGDAVSASGDATVTAEETPVLKLDDGRYTYTDDITNYLIIGTDHSGSNWQTSTDGGSDSQSDDQDADTEYHGEMADFLLVISVNDTKGTYTILPIDRDTMTRVYMMTEDGESYAYSTQQICRAHWYGGNEKQSCRNTKRSVSYLLGHLPIEGYYSIGMDSIKDLNHAVGGVTVTVQGDFSDIDDSLVEGETIKLTDDQAYTYVHERMNMPDDNTNSARMAREQDFMEGFIAAAKEKMKDDASFANDLFDTLDDDSVTSLTGHDISALINSFLTKEDKGILHIDGEYQEGKILDDDQKHGEFTPDAESIRQQLTTMLGLVKQ